MLRSLRIVAASTSRSMASRGSQRALSIARSHLVVQRTVWAGSSVSRAFSVSASRLGQGSCEFETLLLFFMCLRKILLAYAFVVGRCWYWYW